MRETGLFITINHTIDYMERGIMIFRRGIDITRGIGWVVLKVEPVLGPGIARAYLGLLNGTRRQPRAILGPKYARVRILFLLPEKKMTDRRHSFTAKFS